MPVFVFKPSCWTSVLKGITLFTRQTGNIYNLFSQSGPGNDVRFSKKDLFSSLVKYLEDRDAIINIKQDCDWYLMCDNCCQPGHAAQHCNFHPKCHRCNAEHATRNCLRAQEDAITNSADDPITAEDGIKQNAIYPRKVNFTDPKRSKANATEREAKFVKPQGQKAEMHAEWAKNKKKLKELRAENDGE